MDQNHSQKIPEHTGELHCYTILNHQDKPVADQWRKFFPISPEKAPDLRQEAGEHHFGPFHPGKTSLRPHRFETSEIAICRHCPVQIRQRSRTPVNGITIMFSTQQDEMVEAYYLPDNENNGWKAVSAQEFYQNSNEVVPLTTIL